MSFNVSVTSITVTNMVCSAAATTALNLVLGNSGPMGVTGSLPTQIDLATAAPSQTNTPSGTVTGFTWNPGQTLFGLEVFRTTSLQEVRNRAAAGSIHPQALADRFSPSRPTLIPPGRGWSGSFSGRGGLPADVPIRVVLGAFMPPGPITDRFLCISEKVVRLR